MSYPNHSLRNTSRCLIAGLLFCVSAVAQSHPFVSFDFPGGTFTSPNSINLGGSIVGTYFDSNFNIQSFLRTSDGQFTIISVPSFDETTAESINNKGQIVGHAMDRGAPVFSHGFLRTRGGTFTRIDAPGFQNTLPLWISNSGIVAGFAFNASGQTHAFMRDAAGLFTIISPPDAAGGAEAMSVNDSGQVVGTYVDSSSVLHEFFRDSDGTITELDPPTGNFNFSVLNPHLNSSGTIVSPYINGSNKTVSFLRDSAGSFTTLDIANAFAVHANDLNDTGEVVGGLTMFATSSDSVAFRRTPAGVFNPLPVPAGTQSSDAIAVNAGGRVTGVYTDSTGTNHAFVF